MFSSNSFNGHNNSNSSNSFARNFMSRKENNLKQQTRRLSLENLEDRTLLSVSSYLAPSDDTGDTPTAIVQPLVPKQSTAGDTELEVVIPTQSALNADATYNQHDVVALRNFLEQTGSDGVKNGTKINSNYTPKVDYNPDDPSTWRGVTWSNSDTNKQVTAISWTYYWTLGGNLDVSDCTALTSLDCTADRISALNVSGCTALTSLYCGYNSLTSLDVSNCAA